MVTTVGAERAPFPVRWATETRSVVVGVDGSDTTWVTLAWAARHASTLGAELVVVGLGEDVRRRDVQRHAGVRLRFRHGDLGTLRSLDHSTLVVGRHSEPFHPRTIGAEVRANASTLVVVRGLPTAVRGENAVVTAAVGGTADDAVISAAVDICRAAGATVRLLHVHAGFGGAAEAATPDDRPLHRAAEHLDAIAPDLTTQTVLDRRQPHDAVAAPVGDLLVVGRGGDGGLSRMAKTALYHSSCPVLIPSR